MGSTSAKPAASRLTFLTPSTVEHDLTVRMEDGEPTTRRCRFYAISIRTAFELRTVAKPLAQALAGLFSGVGNETHKIEKTQSTGQHYEVERVQGAIDPKLAEVKLKARETAISNLVDAFGDPTNQRVIARVIMDSLREDYTSRPPKTAEIDEFIDTCDAGSLPTLLLGVSEANKDAFGPLADWLSGMMKQKPDSLTDAPAAPKPGDSPAPEAAKSSEKPTSEKPPQ